jgi:hypothetical protein
MLADESGENNRLDGQKRKVKERGRKKDEKYKE